MHTFLRFSYKFVFKLYTYILYITYSVECFFSYFFFFVACSYIFKPWHTVFVTNLVWENFRNFSVFLNTFYIEIQTSTHSIYNIELARQKKIFTRRRNSSVYRKTGKKKLFGSYTRFLLKLMFRIRVIFL